MKTIIFVRHGQSIANAGGVTMAHDAIPLSELGRLHAQVLASLLPDSPSQILASSYLRAQHTAQPYCNRFGMPAQTHPLLHEFSIIDSTLIEGMNGEQRRPIAEAYWQESNPHKRMGENAETFVEFEQRVCDFLPQLHRLPSSTVVFGHGMWIGMLIWKVLGFSATDSMGMKSFRNFQLGLPMPNGAVYRLQEAAFGHWHAQVDEPIMRKLMGMTSNDVVMPGSGISTIPDQRKG